MRKREKMSVAGPAYYQKQMASIMKNENPLYRVPKEKLIEMEWSTLRPIYKYKVMRCKASIKHDPNNEYDPAALRVYADGVMVGHVPQGNLARLAEIADRPGLNMWVQITGGNYKMLEYSGTVKENGAKLFDVYGLQEYEDRFRAYIWFEWDAE